MPEVRTTPALTPEAGGAEAGRRDALLKAGALQNAILTSANFSIIATDEHGVIRSFMDALDEALLYSNGVPEPAQGAQGAQRT